jgi:hypothetical protein
MHDPRAVPQGDARRRPARHGCPVGRFGHLEVDDDGENVVEHLAGVEDRQLAMSTCQGLYFTTEKPTHDAAEAHV